MKRILLICLFSLFALLLVATAPAQTAGQTNAKSAGLGKAAATSNEDTNIRAYIELLRTDLKDSKTEVISEVMQLSAGDAAKFWPIYKEFEAEYTALGDQVIAAVKTYTENYGNLTEGVCDRLANQVLSIEQQRNALKKKYYERVKDGLGAITGMRFLQVENQLEKIVDLQVASHLPVAVENEARK